MERSSNGSRGERSAGPGRNSALVTVTSVIVLLLFVAAFLSVRGRDSPTGRAADLGGHPQTAAATSLAAGSAFVAVDPGDRRWGIEGDTVESTGEELSPPGAPGAPSPSVVIGTRAGGGIRAKLTTPSEQVGLAVRVQDDRNMWFLAPVPRFGAWYLARLRGGRVVESEALKLVSSNGGTEAALVSAGDVLSVIIGGRVRLKVTDPDLAGERRVGVIALKPATGGWSDLRVLP